jgi:hypothetical protein
MVVLGVLFLFNGFFVRVSDTVASIAWFSWIMPTKYAVDASLRNILDGHDYDDGRGGRVTGSQIAADFFALQNRNKWGDLAIVRKQTVREKGMDGE